MSEALEKSKICVSFDYDHDKRYYYLLEAWNTNPNINFWVEDCTPREIQSESVPKIKQVLSTKIGTAECMVAIIGEHSTERHPDCVQIGYNNWQCYEIAKNHEKGNGLVVVRLDRSYSVPSECYGIGASWVSGFSLDAIKKELDRQCRSAVFKLLEYCTPEW